jgi:D-alanyl-D-alanine carboxypeptidase
MMARRLLAVAALALIFPFAPAVVHAGPALVIEPDSGLVLYSEDADVPWHPASLTKLMTAYITFEELRDNKLALEDTVTCSEHALNQAPSKIGLPVGSQMSVDMALKALIVQSANDVAIMLAEKIGGTEEAFVTRMNATAQRLGMTQTRFFNANGLPNDQQVTTARDLALLARALLKEFPQHSYLYSTPTVQFGKRVLRSHNGLLRTFEGADGMKTGFICASGYNVVASATRGDKRIVAVVLGERSGGTRTARAGALIQHGFDNFLWKAMFSTTIDKMEFENSAIQTPPDLHAIVCQPRVHLKRTRKGGKKKKLQQAAVTTNIAPATKAK